MNDQEFLSKLKLALMGRAARIRELEQRVAELTSQLASLNAELLVAKENKVAKLSTDDEKLTWYFPKKAYNIYMNWEKAK